MTGISSYLITYLTFPLFVIFLVPNPVLNLVASPTSTTSVEVNWSQPQGHQMYYKYLVQTYNPTGAQLFNTTVSTNGTDVPNLEPGTRYNISVTTIAATGSESTVEQTFSYTSKALRLNTLNILYHKIPLSLVLHNPLLFLLFYLLQCPKQ